MAKNKAQVKATVLANLKIELNCIIDMQIERDMINARHESPELSEEYFHAEAKLTFQKILLEFSTQIIQSIAHLNKQNYTPSN